MEKYNKFFGSKLNSVLLLILIVLMIFALRIMMQDKEKYFGGGEKNNIEEQEIDDNNIIPGTVVFEENPPIIKEDSQCGKTVKCIASYQPGAVRAFDVTSEGPIIKVDYLSANPNWLPGDDSSGGFFLNKNPKLRQLLISKDVKIFTCGGLGGGPEVKFTGKLDDYVKTMKESVAYNADGWAVYNFDVVATQNGWDGDIVNIYEQCLP